MLAEERKKLIELYRGGYAAVAEALLKITDEEVARKPGPGRWSVREIVHHLADSEMTAAVRLRLLIGTDRPQIVGYDQDEFARRLYYDRSIEASLDAFNAARRSTAELLDRLTEQEWLREGTHSEHGRYTVEKWLQIYAAHAHGHAEQIKVARGSAKGKAGKAS